MGTVEVNAKSSGPQANREVATGCAVCTHAWTEHDEIAARYCNATVAGKFTRGCVCTTDATVKPPG
ncbi:MAG TPA: RGCVC family protein [Actinophytocola sp.]|jgi:hypothetical protein|uniref:RGCVC family protein n=1 Tax=Actinophytocola sp. TaxID=1872138 RepID=UPI002F932D1F